MNDLDIFFQRTDDNPIGDNAVRPAHDGIPIDSRITLRINGVTEANGGEYRCVVRDLTADGGSIPVGRYAFSVVVTGKSE